MDNPPPRKSYAAALKSSGIKSNDKGKGPLLHDLEDDVGDLSCYSCGYLDCQSSCLQQNHKMLSKEDYLITQTHNHTIGKLPPVNVTIRQGDIIVNTDASCRNRAVFGVVVRNSEMKFISNHVKEGPLITAEYSNYDAEADALHFGITIGLSSISRGTIHVFSDCKPVVDCFNTGATDSCPGANIPHVDSIRSRVNRSRRVASEPMWIGKNKLDGPKRPPNKNMVSVHHIQRELNQAADILARAGKNVHILEKKPYSGIIDVLKEDRFIFRVLNKKLLRKT